LTILAIRPEAINVRGTKPTPSLIQIIPALIHIQAHLDQDLSLDLLADEVLTLDILR
jgi:hypothetical protein